MYNWAKKVTDHVMHRNRRLKNCQMPSQYAFFPLVTDCWFYSGHYALRERWHSPASLATRYAPANVVEVGFLGKLFKGKRLNWKDSYLPLSFLLPASWCLEYSQDVWHSGSHLALWRERLKNSRISVEVAQIPDDHGASMLVPDYLPLNLIYMKETELLCI